MAREPLPLETWGKIRRTTTRSGTPAAIAYYRDIDGKRRRLLRTGPTPAKAEGALKDALRERLTPEEEYITPRMTLASLAEAWMKDLARTQRAPGTVRRYQSVINARLNSALGSVRIAEVTVPRLQRIIDHVEQESTAQARMLGLVLTGMLDLAVRNGGAKTNAAKSLRLPAQARKEVRAPDEADLRTLRMKLADYDAQPGYRGNSIRDLGDIADMMLATGARIGEVLALQWGDINLEAWTVTIQSTLTQNADGKLERKTPKTKSSVRTLTIPPFVRAMLSARLKGSTVAWVFPSATGQPRWPENIRNQWKVAVKGSPVEWVGPHDLRKAVATALGTEAAREQLGHASISITDKHYVEKATARPDQTETLERFGRLSA